MMEEHLDVLKATLSSDLYALDVYLTGALQRSYHLVEGFLLAWDRWNVHRRGSPRALSDRQPRALPIPLPAT
jgi:hypothetical protein